MASNTFMRVDDVANELDVSKSYAYKIVRKLNKELESKGIITIAGRVNKQYFMERLCYEAQAKTAERK
jgi:predicted transcriptional regulator